MDSNCVGVNVVQGVRRAFADALEGHAKRGEGDVGTYR